MKTNLLKLTCGLALLGVVATASAQSTLTISGSPGGVVSETLDNNISFTITNSNIPAEDTALGVVFQNTVSGITNFVNAYIRPPYLSTMQMNINGGSPFAVDYWVAGRYYGGVITHNDSYFYSDLSTKYVYSGDTVTLLAGTLSATAPLGFVLPVSGNYNAFIMDDYGNALSAYSTITIAVSSVPEPSTLALAGLGGLAMLWQFRRRK